MEEKCKCVGAALASARKNILLLFLIFNFAFCIVSFGQDLSFEVSVDKNKIPINSDAQLNVTVHGTQDVGAFDLPAVDGFDTRYLGPSTRMSIVNGKITSSITHIYKIIPLEVGQFKIPSFTINYKGTNYTSKPIDIEVLKVGDRADSQNKTDSLVDPKGLEDRVFLICEVEKRRVYINEVVPITVKLYVNKLGIRDIQYPKFSNKDISIAQFSNHKKYQDILGGVGYDVIEFKTEGFALYPGEIVLGPAQLECSLVKEKKSRRRSRSVFFDNFFGGYEEYPLTLKSGEISLDVLDLPIDEKPQNFNGAIGDYNLNIEVRPKNVKVGDPLTIRMVVSGKGNFNTVKVPFFNVEDNFNIYEPQIEQQDSFKIFEQVIIPKSESITEIPAIEFSFFNPGKDEYITIKKDPIAIVVNELPEGDRLKIFDQSNQGSIEREEILGRDLIYIKDSPGRLKLKSVHLYKNKLFVSIQFIPLVMLLLVFISQQRKMRFKRDVGYARRIRAPHRAKKNLLKTKKLLKLNRSSDFFDSVFKTLQEYLGDRFGLPSSGITVNILEYLNEKSIDQNLIDSLRDCFNRCDGARYAPSVSTDEYMRETFWILRETIDKFEKVKI